MGFWSGAAEVFEWIEIGTGSLAAFKSSGSTKLNRKSKLEWKVKKVRDFPERVKSEFELFKIQEEMNAALSEKSYEANDFIKLGARAVAAVIPPVSGLFMSQKTAITLSKVGKVAGPIGHVISFAKNFCTNMEEFKDNQTGERVLKAVGKTVCETAGGWIGGALGGVLGSFVPVVGNAIGAAVGTIIGEKIGGEVFNLPVVQKTIKKVSGWFKSWW